MLSSALRRENKQHAHPNNNLSAMHTVSGRARLLQGLGCAGRLVLPSSIWVPVQGNQPSALETLYMKSGVQQFSLHGCNSVRT